jgi:sugar lactone lactonase YvrE
VYRSFLALAGALALGGGLVLAGVSGEAGAAAPGVRTLAGSGATGTLSSPSGVAIDTSGDLFIADTDHCRVLLVPEHSGTLYGLHVVAHRQYSLAGGTCGGPSSLGFPTGLAVDPRGDVYIAESTDQRVQVIRPGSHVPVTVAGTGVAGYSGNGLNAVESELNQPAGVAVDSAGDLFIADTANCRVRLLPAADGTYFGQAMLAGHLYSIAGNGVCGSGGRTGAASSAQIWTPVALAVDRAGDLFIADNGDQSILEVPAAGGDHYGTSIAAGGIAAIVGEQGNGNGPYFNDGLPAEFETSELNDPEGIAVSPSGTLFITDGSQHCIRVVPKTTGKVFGRAMNGGDYYTLAGAFPINDAAGTGDGTRWVLTHMGVPIGIAVSPSGSVVFSDRTSNAVREIG